jgi:uncharacterized protein (TIGR00375 family)
MKFYCDLHIHSRFSRATSKSLDIPELAFWAQLKGLQVVGTGDFVHPQWMKEIQDKLEPKEEGFFGLKPPYAEEIRSRLPKECQNEVRFVLSAEISNIYKRLDKVRKIHNIIFAPSLAAAEKIQTQLDAVGNIHSDGRPILGLDSRDLLEIVLESDPLSFLVPAHIWTPWFSVFGSKSGFNRFEDCYGDLSSEIFALETGLSSDPLMNWRLSQLDRFVLVSNSDAHSASKLGREATVFDTEFSYKGIYRSLKDEPHDGLLGTIEFFPEEGKYHYDGHRACKMRMHPKETLSRNGLCSICGKPVTVGVMSRVEELADRPEGKKAPFWRPYSSLIPLAEVISQCRRVGPNTKSVQSLYRQMLQTMGNELFLLQDAPLKDIEGVAGDLVAEGIRRIRAKEVTIDAGYDGEFGVIRLFDEDEIVKKAGQYSLF